MRTASGASSLRTMNPLTTRTAAPSVMLRSIAEGANWATSGTTKSEEWMDRLILVESIGGRGDTMTLPECDCHGCLIGELKHPIASVPAMRGIGDFFQPFRLANRHHAHLSCIQLHHAT